MSKFEGLALPWWAEIDAAKRNDPKPLIQALRSDKPIPLRGERWLRNSIAAILAGEFKRARGRPPDYDARSELGKFRRLIRRNPRLASAVNYVDRYRHVQKARYGRTRGVEAKAIERAAEKYGVQYQTIHNYLHRSRRPRPAKKKRRT
jgi:hypothetical protein